MAATEESILVVGGGIGGLAMALALGRQGRRVTLLEQLDEIAPIGYGVQIGPNVMPRFDELGVGQEVRAAAYLPPTIELLDAYTAQSLALLPASGAAFEAQHQHPYIAIHRADLHDILLRACRALPQIALLDAANVVHLSQDARQVTVRCTDGREFRGPALIAADGLRSKLRALMFPDDAPRDTGYVAHRTIVPWHDAPASLRARPGVSMWSGDGFHLIYYPLRDRTELNIVGVFRVQPSLGAATQGHAQTLREAVAGCQPEVRDALGCLNLERQWAIADRNPLPQWSQGRVTLLGDAAHATLQSLAQGAGMAVEDAVVLARLMAGCGDDYAGAFTRFTRQRLTRTARVQLVSRALWEDYHCGGIAAQVRNQTWGERSPQDYLQCVRWLWTPLDLSATT